MHLKTVVKIKRAAFGDPSTEVQCSHFTLPYSVDVCCVTELSQPIGPSQLGDSHRLLGTIYLSEGDVASAEKHLQLVSQ